jgi:hypothetical protein
MAQQFDNRIVENKTNQFCQKSRLACARRHFSRIRYPLVEFGFNAVKQSDNEGLPGFDTVADKGDT